MTEYKQTLYVPDWLIEKYKPLMDPGNAVDYEEHGLKTYATAECFSISFPDGCVMDVKICTGASYDHDPLWAEGVLYKDGVEMTFTDVIEKLETDFVCELDTDDSILHTVYRTTVLAESKKPA